MHGHTVALALPLHQPRVSYAQAAQQRCSGGEKIVHLSSGALERMRCFSFIIQSLTLTRTKRAPSHTIITIILMRVGVFASGKGLVSPTSEGGASFFYPVCGVL